MAASGGAHLKAGNHGSSYASKVTGIKSKGRKKLNVLDILLERRENAINYNLSKEELAKLLFVKMAIDPKKVKKIDTAGFGKILIELTDDLDPERFSNCPSFDIREGLRTKYYRPHHRKDTLVTISWLDLETPDALLSHILGHFGKIKSDVQWVKIKEEEHESNLAKMLNSITSGERQVWMEVEKPIPSYAIIDGRKVKIYHPGQRRTCARCQKTADTCLGQSNARLCEENDGVKVNVDNVWRDILEKVEYKDWDGGEIVSSEENKVDNDVDENKENEEFTTKYPNCDGIIISNVPEDTTPNEIETILNSAVAGSTENVSILQADNVRSRLVKNVSLDKVLEIVKRVDHMSYKGNLLHCRPHVPATPPKEVTDAVEGTQVEMENATKVKDVVIPTIKVVSGIPGLTVEAAKKALKAASRKQNKKDAKERKKLKKAEEQNLTASRMDDFLANHTPKRSVVDEFEFSDYSDDSDGPEVFEDSKELQSEDEFLTPINFSSVFGQRTATLSTSTPNLSVKVTSKRGASSPPGMENQKKVRSKSSLPIRRLAQ